MSMTSFAYALFETPTQARQVYFFLLTPTVLPLLPVVLVCCPRTLKFYCQCNKNSPYERMSHTSMSTNLLQPLDIFTEFIIKSIGEKLRIFPIDNILLSVEKPFRDFVLSGILDDGNDALEFFSSQFPSTGVSVTLKRGTVC